MKGLNADWGDLDNHEVEDPLEDVLASSFTIDYLAHAFVAVPRAAPLVRMERELISVGYSLHDVLVSSLPVIGNDLPRHTLPSNSEKHVVEEEEGNRCASDLLRISIAWLLVVPDQDRDDEIAKGLPSSGIHHHAASTPALNIGDTN